MKQIPDKTYNDLKRILPILARLADGYGSDPKIANAGRLARKYGRKFNQQTNAK